MTKFNNSVDEAVDGEAVSVGRTLIERRTGRFTDKEPVNSRGARDVQTCTAREYTPAYRMELEEFCFPTIATKACPSKIGRMRNDAMPHCLRSAARPASSNVWRIP